MNRKSAIKKHVQTSLVARIIYRAICILLIAVSIVGIYFTATISEEYGSLRRRDKTITATITNRSKTTDQYGYDNCAIGYKFTLDGRDYASTTGFMTQRSNYNCHVSDGQKVTVRYQHGNPTNNAYGDNEQDAQILLLLAVGLAALSVIPLGIGFVGLVAIHKAMQAEDEVEEAELAVAKRRTNRRRAKKADQEEGKQRD